jgi:pyridoxamine 5'-phosphate oxidase
MDVSRVSLPSVTGVGLSDLPEFGVPPADPIALASEWFVRAIEGGVREPGSMALATASADGVPSSRFVLLKGFNRDGLLFVSQKTSRKGRDLAGNPYASASFYWQEHRLQLHIAGRVEEASAAESDEIFGARPLGLKAAGAVSRQSETLTDENLLAEQIQRLVAAGSPVPRPERWTAYRIVPERIEFWHGDVTRMHRRLEYTRDGAQWSWRRLQP